MNNNINLKVFGKWIWAGEYAVLKSHPALIFPCPSQFMELNYGRKESSLKVIVKKEIDPHFPCNKNFDLQTLFQNLLNQALRTVSKSSSNLKGTIELKSYIAFGSGLGASAVICVLIGRLFYSLKWIKKEELFSFCHALENILHGQSSGADIAGTLTGKPILYSQSGNNITHDRSESLYSRSGLRKNLSSQIQIFKPQWQPYVFLSYSKKGCSTKENIKKMKLFWEKAPKRAEALNQQMAKAVFTAQMGFETKNKKEGLALLKKSFLLAEDCFLEWDLIGKSLKAISFLKEQGALAVKPTGSGGGGYVLSLWQDMPPARLRNNLIPAF